MIWHYFPIGMRFPVRDFSDETKRRCWEIALSAIFASDPNGTVLYEACESFDPGAGTAVYTCIVCYEGIKQSRAAGKRFQALDALTSRLTLSDPFVQANYLESFGPYPELARIGETGALSVEESAKAFLPSERPEPLRASGGLNLLIVFDTKDAARSANDPLCTAAAEQGWRVKRMAVTDGGTGTVRALVAHRKGRFETIFCTDTDGARKAVTIGILPRSRAVIEAEDGIDFSEQIEKTLDLGYRRLILACGDAAVRVLSDADADPRLSQCTVTVLRAVRTEPQSLALPDAAVRRGAETVLDLIDFDTAVRRADLVLLKTDAFSYDPETAAGAALLRLRESSKPTWLLTRALDVPEDRLKAEHPELRGIVTLSPDAAEDEKTLSDAFRCRILPASGNAIAKQGTV